jgi:hypothetical protein
MPVKPGVHLDDFAIIGIKIRLQAFGRDRKPGEVFFTQIGDRTATSDKQAVVLPRRKIGVCTTEQQAALTQRIGGTNQFLCQI